MRVLLDFYFNEESETLNGIRYNDVQEIESTELIPVWSPESSTHDIPDFLYVHLYAICDKEDAVISGQYILNDTQESVDAAIKNYNDVIEKLLINGYCRISDFKNVDWN